MPSADWAAEGFRRCCQASDGAWVRVLEPGPGARTARSPTRSRSPPGHRKQPRAGGSFLAIGRPRWPSPQVAMIQGRRASKEETPTSIWLDPPSAEETQDLLVVLQAMRTGAFTVQGFPGVAHQGALRVRGVDQPPRQGIATPAPSSPEPLAEPNPRGPAMPHSPVAARAWCPARAFAALTVATLAAGASGAGLPPGRARAFAADRPAGPGGWEPGWALEVAQGGTPPPRPRLAPVETDPRAMRRRLRLHAGFPGGEPPATQGRRQPEDGDSHPRHGQRHILAHRNECRGPEFGHRSPGGQGEGGLPQGGESRI